MPGALRPLFDESFALAATLDALARPNAGPHEERDDFADPFAVRPSVTDRYLPLAIIGHDSGTGRLVRREGFEESGGLQVEWPGLRDEPAILRRHEALERRLRGQGARLLRNPLWQLLPAEMAFLNDARGPMISVHPLGGCAMGTAARMASSMRSDRSSRATARRCMRDWPCSTARSCPARSRSTRR